MRTRSTPTSPAITSPALSLALVAGLGVAGCTSPDKPLDPDELTARMATEAREVVHQSGASSGFAQSEDSGLRKLADGMSNLGGDLTGSSAAMPSPVPPGMMSALKVGSVRSAISGMTSMLTPEEQFDDLADKLRAFMKERLFTANNLETKTDDEAIYLLHADPTCRPLPADDDPPGTVPAIDAGCAEKLGKVAVRLSLKEDGDGGRFTILVGPNRLELSQFVVHSDLLALEGDLAKAYNASRYIDDTLGSASPNPTRFEALTGRMRYAAHKDGEKKITGSVSVLEAVHIATLDDNGAPEPEIQLGASDPTFSVTADGNTQKLTVNVNLAALDVRGDWDPQSKDPIKNRDWHLHVGGLYGQTTFTEASDAFVGKGLGLAASYFEVRGKHVLDIGLNPQNGQRFDLDVSLDPHEQPIVAVTPRFDLSLGFHFDVVAPDYKTAPPSYLLDETYGVRLDNGGATATVAGVPSTSTFGGGLKVNAGTLTIASTAAASSVVVPTGKCLTTLSTAPQGTHPVLGTLAVVDCP